MLIIRGPHLLTIDYAQLALPIVLAIGYVVIVATFVAYQLMYMGQKYLRAEVVGMYIYPQPFLTAMAAVMMGLDEFAWYKLGAAVLILAGVCIVNSCRQRSAKTAAQS